MCVGGSAPSSSFQQAPPAKLPEAPAAPATAATQSTKEADAKRRRAAAGEGTRGTILTSSRGLEGGGTGTTKQKTLLGE